MKGEFCTPKNGINNNDRRLFNFLTTKFKCLLNNSFSLSHNVFSDEFCEEFPHSFIPTPGYWIECSRQKITSDTIWDESESDHENEIQEGEEEEEEINAEGMEHENGFRRRDRSMYKTFYFVYFITKIVVRSLKDGTVILSAPDT